MRLGKSRRALAGTLFWLAISAASAASAADLATVQQALADRGYAVGKADGIMGPRTAAAIRAFETEQGWAATGVVSDRLQRALQPPRALPPIALPPAAVSPDLAGRAQAVAQIAAEPPSAKPGSAASPTPKPEVSPPVFFNRNWLIRDLQPDGAPAGPAFSLFLEANGNVAGPRFAKRMRWQADGRRLILRYESVIGQAIERTGEALDADRIAGEARDQDGTVWRWTAEARPQG